MLPAPDTQEPKDKADKKDQPEPGVKVLDRGPIHEAFAQPGADVRGKEGMTAPKAPPPPIPELPPDTKPDGKNVKWIPGYWQWDDAKQDFIWVSGFYRDVPPNRDWQAGKWTDQNGKWTYTPGWWRPTNMNNWRIDMPEPPKSVESGPSTPSDDPNAVWIPGAWEYRNEKFVWRAGYWANRNGNMMWTPGQYVQTGSGYAYAPGFWDYPLEQRGILYAPVQFTSPLWLTPGWTYQPQYALDFGDYGGWGTSPLFGSLYMDPWLNNYYYGGWGGGWGGWGLGGWGGGWGWGGWGGWLGFGLSWCGGWGCGWGWGGGWPWCSRWGGYCNNLWNHYCWLNRNNHNWSNNVHHSFAAHGAHSGNVHGGVAGVHQGQFATNHGGAARGLGGGAPAHLGGAAQAAAHAAAATATPTPLVRPASQVARSLQSQQGATARTPARVPTSPLAAGAGSTVRSAASVTAQSSPIHAGSATQHMQQAGGLSNNGGVRITPGSSSLMNNPAVTHAGGSALSTPHTGPSVPNRLSQVSPSAQGMPRNLSQMQLGSSAYHPSAPSYHPSAPSMRSMPSGFGGAGLGGAGRGAPAMMGGGGGMRMGGGGGGARMGGGGGGHGGGGHGGGHR